MPLRARPAARVAAVRRRPASKVVDVPDEVKFHYLIELTAAQMRLGTGGAFWCSLLYMTDMEGITFGNRRGIPEPGEVFS